MSDQITENMMDSLGQGVSHSLHSFPNRDRILLHESRCLHGRMPSYFIQWLLKINFLLVAHSMGSINNTIKV
jgi:hypothetical protein